MVYEIVWTLKAVNSYAKNLEYLETHWTEREKQNFIAIVEKKFEVLRLQPYISVAKSNKNIHIRQAVLNKRVCLIYRVKPHKKQIELILFWNTYQDPARLKGSSV